MTDTLDVTSSILLAARTAATAVLTALPAGEQLTVGEPTADASRISLDGKAVSARFSGSTSGEVVVVVASAVVDALQNSPLGSLDLAQALRPALEAAVATVGPVTLGPAQVLDAQPALDGLLAKPWSTVVPLLAADRAHAAVGIAVSSPVQYAPVSSARPVDAGPLSGVAGLDLLRGVEMEVAAELGRTRMTLNELLSLTDGAVIELDRAAGAPADLLVNGRLIARGEVVVIDENFGLRITEIVSDSTVR